MGALSLRLLGPPQVRLGEQILTFKTRKTLALLAYLATAGGLHRREHLAALLWPLHDDEGARANLRTAISHLRRSLGAAETVLAVTRETVGLSPAAPLTLDLQVLARAQRLAHAREVVPGLRGELERAVAMYRGPFLEDVGLHDAPEFETWVNRQRVFWLGMVGELLERLAALQAEGG